MEYFIWNINPNFLELGSIKIHWYALFFIGSFFVGLLIFRWIYKREGRDPDVTDYLFIYILVGAAVGARLMHCFAYEPDFYLSHPFEIFKIWKGGLASHGAILGILFTLYIFSKRYKESYMWLLSRATIPGTLTAASIRFGNFFNSEILGLPTDKPWAVIFERVDMIPRHPVQLYEAAAYLVLLFILVIIYLKNRPDFATLILPGVFLAYMFTVRFLLEYTKTRQADYTLSLPFTIGQILSIPFILLGIIWITWVYSNRKKYIARV